MNHTSFGLITDKRPYSCYPKKVGNRNRTDGEIVGVASKFHQACLAGNVERVKSLLENDDIGFIDEEICGSHVEYAGDLLTPLCCAIACKSVEAVKLLLSFGANVNLSCGMANGKSSPLHFAVAQEDNVDCIRILLKSGANLATKDAKGQSALHIAASMNGSEAVCVLLDAGADPNLLDWMERTALHCAVATGVLECVRLLLEEGRVDINSQDTHGYTALHLSATNGNAKCTSLLLHHGSDMTIQTFSGTTAFSIIATKMPDVMNRFGKMLDSSVSLHDNDVADGNCELKMDFSVLIPNTGNKPALTINKPKEKANTGEGKLSQHQPVATKEMELLTCLVSTGNKKLLTHPLTEAFLLLKWRRVRKFFLASLFFQTALVALFTVYVVEVYLVQCPYPVDSTDDLDDSSPLSQEDEHMVSTIEKSGSYSGDPPDEGFLWYRAVPTKKRISQPSDITGSGHYHSSDTKERISSDLLATRTTQSSIHLANQTSPSSERQNESDDEVHHDNDMLVCTLSLPLQVIWILLIIFTCVMILQEIFQLVHNPSAYVVSSENYAQLLLIMTVLISSWQRFYSEEFGVFGLWYWQYPSAACGMLITWALILFQMGRFPSNGLYAEMLGKAVKNCGIVISAYACLLIAFTFAFCVLFPGQPTFKTFTTAILKVLVMMIGQVEYEELVYDEEHVNLPVIFPLTANLILGVFVVIMTIVLMNLLVGLAVSDIQGLKKGAKLSRLCNQTKLIARFESFIYSKKLQVLLPSSLIRMVQESSSILAGESRNFVFYFQPNDPRDRSLPKVIQQAALSLVVSSSQNIQSHYSFSQDGKSDIEERLNLVEGQLQMVRKDTTQILEILMALHMNDSKSVVIGEIKTNTV